jgi:hypothetical protein
MFNVYYYNIMFLRCDSLYQTLHAMSLSPTIVPMSLYFLFAIQANLPKGKTMCSLCFQTEFLVVYKCYMKTFVPFVVYYSHVALANLPKGKLCALWYLKFRFNYQLSILYCVPYVVNDSFVVYPSISL